MMHENTKIGHIPTKVSAVYDTKPLTIMITSRKQIKNNYGRRRKLSLDMAGCRQRVIYLRDVKPRKHSEIDKKERCADDPITGRVSVTGLIPIPIGPAARLPELNDVDVFETEWRTRHRSERHD